MPTIETNCNWTGYSTHNDGCWRWHLPCAVYRIEALQKKNQEIRNAMQHTWNALCAVEKQRDKARAFSAVWKGSAKRWRRLTQAWRAVDGPLHSTVGHLLRERDEARKLAARLYQALKDHCGVCPKCGAVLETIAGDYEPIFRCPTCSKV